MSKPTDATVTAWVRLVRARDAAILSIERALKNAGLPPLAWYDVLLEVERAGGDGIRPYELQDQLLLPQYGISRLIDRMVRAGFLDRVACADDGRGHITRITSAGRDARRRMWLVYGRGIEQAVGQKLSTKEIATLAGLLQKLL